MAEDFGYGMNALDLAPQVDGEGTKWRFLGIQSKNCKEWIITHLANMGQNITTVSLYDTLGLDATRFILDQTEISTLCLANEFIQQICDLKAQDADMEVQKMHRLKTIVCYTDDIKSEDKAAIEKAGLKLYTIREVVEAGADAKKYNK